MPKMDIDWFKECISPLMTSKGFLLEYKNFENGDFGDINRVDFEGNVRSGSIDFWSSGWLGIYIYDFEMEKDILNVLLEPSEEGEKKVAFEELSKLLRLGT